MRRSVPGASLCVVTDRSLENALRGLRPMRGEDVIQAPRAPGARSHQLGEGEASHRAGSLPLSGQGGVRKAARAPNAITEGERLAWTSQVSRNSFLFCRPPGREL